MCLFRIAFKAGLSRLGVGLTASELDELAAMLDQHNAGVVQFCDFVELLDDDAALLRVAADNDTESLAPPLATQSTPPAQVTAATPPAVIVSEALPTTPWAEVQKKEVLLCALEHIDKVGPPLLAC